MEPEKSTECPEHYRKLLTLKEKLTIETRVFYDKLALFTDFTTDLFNRKDELRFKNKLNQGTLDKDFDEVLMKTGDKYPPSKRLNDFVNKLYTDDTLPLGWIPNSELNKYFRQYHTYKAVYRKLKAGQKQEVIKVA